MGKVQKNLQFSRCSGWVGGFEKVHFPSLVPIKLKKIFLHNLFYMSCLKVKFVKFVDRWMESERDEMPYSQPFIQSWTF